eukprot:8523485-Prorocentrum_lima.AAC.1
MTSSLVGSEMCIRDRECLGCGYWNCRQRRWCERCNVHHLESGWRWCRPVSYTHLTLPTICSV